MTICSCTMVCPVFCAFEGSASTADGGGNSPLPVPYAPLSAGRPGAAGKSNGNRDRDTSSGSTPSWGNRSFSSSPARTASPAPAFGADAYPVDAGRHRQSPVCLYRDLETRVVEGIDEGLVELQQGFSSRRDQQPSDTRTRCREEGRRARCKLSRIIEDAALRSVRAHKIRVALRAGGPGPVLVFAGP